MKCPYCAYRPHREKGFVDVYRGVTRINMEQLPPDVWSRFLSTFPDTIVDICGGEPLLYKGLNKIIDGLPETSRYAMTSNTTQLETVFTLNPSKCFCWTASFHPFALKPFSDLDFFIDALQKMKKYGYHNIACTIVYLPWKHSLKYIDDTTKRFVKEQIPLNWQPYMFHGYEWEKENLKIAKRLFPRYKPNWEPFGKRKLCDAGREYFVVNSDGTIYPCVSHLTFDTNRLGNIKDGWSLLNGDFECVNPCVYPCDYLNNDVRELT